MFFGANELTCFVEGWTCVEMNLQTDGLIFHDELALKWILFSIESTYFVEDEWMNFPNAWICINRWFFLCKWTYFSNESDEFHLKIHFKIGIE